MPIINEATIEHALTRYVSGNLTWNDEIPTVANLKEHIATLSEDKRYRLRESLERTLSGHFENNTHHLYSHNQFFRQNISTSTTRSFMAAFFTTVVLHSKAQWKKFDIGDVLSNRNDIIAFIIFTFAYVALSQGFFQLRHHISRNRFIEFDKLLPATKPTSSPDDAVIPRLKDLSWASLEKLIAAGFYEMEGINGEPVLRSNATSTLPFSNDPQEGWEFIYEGTPLQYAVSTNDLDLARELCHDGADVSKVHLEKLSLLDTQIGSIFNDNPEILSRIDKIKNEISVSPLELAAQSHNTPMLELLNQLKNKSVNYYSSIFNQREEKARSAGNTNNNSSMNNLKLD